MSIDPGIIIILIGIFALAGFYIYDHYQETHHKGSEQ